MEERAIFVRKKKFTTVVCQIWGLLIEHSNRHGYLRRTTKSRLEKSKAIILLRQTLLGDKMVQEIASQLSAQEQEVI